MTNGLFTVVNVNIFVDFVYMSRDGRVLIVFRCLRLFIRVETNMMHRITLKCEVMLYEISNEKTNYTTKYKVITQLRNLGII